jgi:hypothetical protein
MHMLILEICNEHASHLYVLESVVTLAHVPFVATVTKMISISNYSYNKICDEHTVHMLFTFEYNDEFMFEFSSTSRGSNIKILPCFKHIIAKIY